MSRTRTFLLVLTAIVGVGVREGQACSCIPISPCMRYSGAEAVFLADVINVDEDARQKRVRMHVVRVWKGEVAEDVIVTAGPGTSASCSIDVEVGQRRVVYAGGSKDRFSTSLCSGGWALKPGAPDPQLPPLGGRVEGRVVQLRANWTSRDDLFAPVAGVRVWVGTPRGPIDAHTDVDGRFRLEKVPPGRHVVRVDLGPAEEAWEEIVDLRSPDDCADVFVSTRPSGRLTGRVVDGNGSPLDELRVYAIPTTHDWSRHDLTDTGSAETDKNGTFTFKGLKPGTYVIGVNAFDAPLVKRPYLPIYYPGVESRAQAATIDIGQGATAPLETMVLRRPLPQATLTAEIVCRDGTRPNSASVQARLVTPHNVFTESAYTENGGRIVITMLRGYKYEVKGAVTAKVTLADGTTGISWPHTAAQFVDSAAAPPLLTLVSTLEKCDAPGGPSLAR